MLRCIECAATSLEGVGWRAYLISDCLVDDSPGDEDEDEAAAVAIYCVSCAAREFGGPHYRTRKRDARP